MLDGSPSAWTVQLVAWSLCHIEMSCHIWGLKLSSCSYEIWMELVFEYSMFRYFGQGRNAFNNNHLAQATAWPRPLDPETYIREWPPDSLPKPPSVGFNSARAFSWQGRLDYKLRESKSGKSTTFMPPPVKDGRTEDNDPLYLSYLLGIEDFEAIPRVYSWAGSRYIVINR